MSSELDKLVEAITELVVKELSDSATAPAAVQPVTAHKQAGLPVLVVAGPEVPQDRLWAPLLEASNLARSVLVWSGGRQDQLPAGCSGWKIEARSGQWGRLVSGYKAVVLLGAELSVLGSMANLGGDGLVPAGVAVAALAAGKPVFVDDHFYEQFRRHCSRLPAGLVRRFEEFYRVACSFGVEMGTARELAAFLGSLGTSSGGSSPLAKSGGRDVVTVEDVEAVRHSGVSRMQVALGTIVTPLAAQKAAEWGIEVSYQ